MLTCTYASVAQEIASLAGEDYAALAVKDLTDINRYIARRLKTAWERDWFPELMRSEQRQFRNTWTAQAYASGAQVWHADTLAYYEANAATLAGDVPGTSSKWDALAEIDPYVDLEQTDQTPIGTVRGVYRDDPRYNPNPRRVGWALGDDAIYLLGSSIPTSVWVWFKIRRPAFDGAAFSTADTYAIGDRRFYASTTVGFEGDYWTATAATTAGESPESAPTKWAKVEFPDILKPYVVNAAYADWLRADGQRDSAILEDQAAEGLLIEAQFRARANQEPTRYRPT